MKKGFTLAEVLITLGIIGIVAAMTLPTLIENYNRKIVETRLEHFYSAINQVIRRAELDYGERSSWYTLEDKTLDGEKRWIEKYFIPYLNGAKIEIITNPSNNRTYPIIMLPNGSSFYPVSYNHTQIRDWAFVAGDPRNCWKHYLSAHVNEIEGKCQFTFYYNPLDPLGWNFEPFDAGWDKTENSLKYHANYGCYQAVVSLSSWRGYCSKLVQYNGWTFPKDYPFKVHYK